MLGCKSLLDQILHRTIFPNDNEPHARRLFADLASALIYVVAFVGIMNTVFEQPLSGVLATSGVLAIVLGLALQNTLADVFSGLAINIERPFGAGDWITMADTVEGQIIEINWRATRIKTASSDVIVIPNSVLAKDVVTNHRRLNDPYVCTIHLKISHLISPTRVLDLLQGAAAGSPGITSGSKPQAYACGFSEALVTYGLSFAIDDFIKTADVQSQVVGRVVEAFRGQNIPIGVPAMDVRLIQQGNVQPRLSIRAQISVARMVGVNLTMEIEVQSVFHSWVGLDRRSPDLVIIPRGRTRTSRSNRQSISYTLRFTRMKK